MKLGSKCEVGQTLYKNSIQGAYGMVVIKDMNVLPTSCVECFRFCHKDYGCKEGMFCIVGETKIWLGDTIHDVYKNYSKSRHEECRLVHIVEVE